MLSKFKRIGLISLLLAFILFGTGAGCSSTPAATNNNLVVWGFDNPDVFKPIIKDFNKVYKNINVSYVQKVLDDHYELDSLNAIAAGHGPDVWSIPNDWLVRHTDKLTTYIDPKPGKDDLSKIQVKDYFLPLVLNGGSVNGKLYGMTPSVDTLRIFYNSTLLSKALADFDEAQKSNKDYRKKIDDLISKGPVFWDDIIELNKAFTVKNGATISRTFLATGTGTNTMDSVNILYALMLQNKSRLFSDDGQTAVFNLPVDKATGEQVVPATKALDFYSTFAKPEDPNYSFTPQSPNSSDAFANGQAMAIFGFQTYSDYLNQRFPTLKYRQWPMPQILSSSNQDIVDLAQFNLMTVPTASKNQATAWNFIKYATTLDQATYTSATKRPGSQIVKDQTKPTVTDRQSLDNIDRLQKVTAIVMPQNTRFPKQFDAAFLQAIDDVNARKVTSQQAMDQAADKITQLLRDQGY